MSNVRDLNQFRRRFVRGKNDPSSPEYDPTSDDTFFMGIACAEWAAHCDQIDCAACGSKDICRTPLTNPWQFGALTSEKTGHLFGYALCAACHERRKTEPDAVYDLVDAAFDGVVEAIGEPA